MKLRRSTFYLFFILFIIACNQQQEQNENSSAFKSIASQGIWQNPDSFAQPIAIPAGKPIPIPVGKPTINLTNLNVHVAGIPKIINAEQPNVITPGTDTFSLPKVIPVFFASDTTSASYSIGDEARVKSKPAGSPEIVIAKDMANKDINPANFSTFGKLQGLNHGTIACMLQDKSGNLWFGTYGGVTKYDGKSFTNFTDKEGLPSNTILSIVEDKNGNLWFGTNGAGVSKYDGKSFTNFTDQQGLTSNTVLSIVEDKNGNIWFGTDEVGVSKYDGKSFTNFTDQQGLASNTVLSIIEDKNGNIWFGTDGGVSKYDGKSFTNFTDKEGLPNKIVRSILEDKNGNLWFGTDGSGISKYDGNRVEEIERKIARGESIPQRAQQDLKKTDGKLVKSFTNYTNKEGLTNNTILSIVEDKNGNIWFGTYGGGLSKYNGKSFTNFTDKEGLAYNGVRCILEDKNGNLWVGMDGAGVSKYDGKSFTNFTEKQGLVSNIVRSILEDKNGNLWLGTFRGGVSRLDVDRKSFTNFTEKQGLTNNTVRTIVEDKNGNLWFGTYGGGVSLLVDDGKSFINFTEKEGLANNIVLSMLEDKNGNLWFGTNEGVSKYDGNSFTNFTEKEGLANNIVLSMVEDKNGNLWFGTYGGGLSRLANDGKSFTNFTEKEGLVNNTILSIVEDKSGNLWFGTNGGVSKYDGKSFTNFTEKEGLANNTVLSILEDKDGNIWFGTRFGIAYLSAKKLADFIDSSKLNALIQQKLLFKNYNYTDGFLDVGVNGGKTMIQDKQGDIWIGANDHLTLLHSENFKSDTIAPNIQLNNLELFNENIDWTTFCQTDQSQSHAKDTNITLGNGVTVGNFKFDGLTRWYNLPEQLSLAYNNNYLTFNFIGITMNQARNVKYQYKLDGLDEHWSAVTNRTSAPYGNLPHGTYTFKVKAMNSDGIWSNEFNYTFTIRPPWWQTWWFKFIVIVFTIGSIWFYIKRREHALKERQKQLEKTVEERTFEVVKQKEVIEEKHREITDSINYAERIQRSFLATTEILDKNLKDYFVFFRPKAVVSGDFYWAGELINGNFAFSCADSTGHGVPGAIMSILNISSLEKSIEQETEPHKILDKTRKIIIERLKKDGSPDGGKDGMDCSLLVINKDRTQLSFAAANNPVFIVRHCGLDLQSKHQSEIAGQARNDVFELIEFKPDKMPVGKHDKDTELFNLHTTPLQKGDIIYTLTDGFSDQFGGDKGKKYMIKNLKALLLQIASLSMQEQEQKLAEEFASWKGENEQVDDVCIIGVRI